MARSTTDPQVIPPRQERSRATMERIVTAAEELLREKPFEQLTIAEISQRSGSAPTAFYARFSDKNALLLEVHERFRVRASHVITESFASRPAETATIEELVEGVVSEIFAVYRASRNLLRSVLLADNPLIYDRAADLTRTISAALTVRVQSRTQGEAHERLARDIDFAIRTALAVLQQSLVYADHEPSRFALDEDELRGRLVALVVAACRTQDA